MLETNIGTTLETNVSTTLETNIGTMLETNVGMEGFKHCTALYRWYNFISWVPLVQRWAHTWVA